MNKPLSIAAIKEQLQEIRSLDNDPSRLPQRRPSRDQIVGAELSTRPRLERTANPDDGLRRGTEGKWPACHRRYR